MKKNATNRPSFKIEDGFIISKGYGTLPTSVMTDENLTINAKALYAYLICRTGAGANCYPSVNTIMKELDIKTKNSFRDYRDELIVKGLLRIEKRNTNKGRNKSNAYFPTKINPKEIKKIKSEKS